MKGYNPNTCNKGLRMGAALKVYLQLWCCLVVKIAGPKQCVDVREAEDENGSRSALSDRNPLLPSQTLNGVYKSESPGYDRCAEHTSRSCCLNH